MSTNIEWCDETWNPIAAYDKQTGKRGWYCAHISPGCVHCYAEKMNTWRGNGQLYRVPNAEKVDIRIVESVLARPLSWRKPRRIFVCSMTDLFLDEHSDEMIARVWQIMAEAQHHTFQVLTKRPERMLKWFTEYLPEACSGESPAPVWPLPNVWVGVSVEDQQRGDERIPLLLQTPAAIRFLSCEPLLGPVDILESIRVLHRQVGDFAPPFDEAGGIDWVITGGESGAGARPCDVEWITSIVADCDLHGVACFVKQLGAVPMESETAWRARMPIARLLNARNDKRVPDGFVPLKLADSHGGNIEEWPEELRVRQFPTPIEASV